MDSGKVGILIANLSWISASVLLSSSLETNVIANPLVPKRPALPTFLPILTKIWFFNKNLVFAYSMQVGVTVSRHVVVEYYVHTLDIDSSGNDVGGD